MSEFENSPSAPVSVSNDEAVPTIFCCICLEDKPLSSYQIFKFKCVCKSKDNGTCDGCVVNWLKVNNFCPNCKLKNYAYKVNTTPRPDSVNGVFDFSYDCSFNPVPETATLEERKALLKIKFESLIRLNKKYYNDVIQYVDVDEEEPTMGQMLYKNAMDFIIEHIIGYKYRNVEVDDKMPLYLNDFAFVEQFDGLYSISGLNEVIPFNFNTYNADSFDDVNDLSILIRNGDTIQHYKFNIYSDDYIRERITQDIQENIVFHDLDDVIDHLLPANRQAFHYESPFWNFVREDSLNNEVMALINVSDYEDFLFDSHKGFNYIFYNGSEGYYERFNYDIMNLDIAMVDEYFVCCHYEDSLRIDV